MRRREVFLVFLFFIGVSVLFFYKTFFMGFIPFPGDLLIAENNPWRTYSYLGYKPGSFPNKSQYFDVLRQMYPWRTYSLDILKRGEIPFWNPHNFSGAPFLANGQSAVLYPFNVFFLFLPQHVAWSVLIILQPVLSGLFTYLFARRVGIGIVGSLLASLAFSYSLFMSVFLQYATIGHTILWLPIMLWSIEGLGKKVCVRYFLVLLVSTVFAFLAGHLQMFFFILGFLFLFAFVRVRSMLIHVIITAMLALSIAAFELLPTVELVAHSARVPHDFQFLIEKLLIQPYQAALLFSPDFFGNPATRNYLIPDTYPGNALYIGLIPFLFALFAVVGARKHFLVWQFFFFAILLILLTFRWPVSELLYKVKLPLIATGSPTNALFVLAFCLSVLSGFGIDRWMQERKEGRMVVFSATLVFVALWVFVLVAKPQVVSTRNFFYSTGLLAVFVFFYALAERVRSIKSIIAVLFLLITFVDLFYFFQKFNPFVPRALVFPKADVFTKLAQVGGVDRFWGYGTAAIDANLATQYTLFSPDGYDPLYPRRYGEFIHSSRDGKIKTSFTSSTRSDAIVAPGYGEEDLMVNPYRLRVLDALGVRYILDREGNPSSEKTFPPERFSLVWEGNGWRIFENRKAAPRVFLTTSYKQYRTSKEFEELFYALDFNPAHTVLLEDDPPRKLQELPVSGIVRLLSYEPNKVVVETKAQGDALLFLSDTYYPGWKVTIDEKASKVLRANYTFRAVLVPKGTHTVIFSYEPSSFAFGTKVTIISLGLTGLLGLTVRRKFPFVS